MTMTKRATDYISRNAATYEQRLSMALSPGTREQAAILSHRESNYVKRSSTTNQRVVTRRSLDALVGKTAKLPRIAIRAPSNRSVIGRNTEDQMLIGVFWGYVAMMEGMVAKMKAEIGRPAKVVATGGLAILFDDATDIFDHVDADLTLDGLAILARQAESA